MLRTVRVGDVVSRGRRTDFVDPDARRGELFIDVQPGNPTVEYPWQDPEFRDEINSLPEKVRPLITLVAQGVSPITAAEQLGLRLTTANIYITHAKALLEKSYALA